MKEPTPISPEAIATLNNSSRAVQIQAMKDWCLDNYEAGADVMVECWETSDYNELFVNYRNVDTDDGIEEVGDTLTFAEAFGILLKLCSVYSERQADADFHARS